MEIKQDKMQIAIFHALVGEATEEDTAALEEFDRRYRAGELPRGSTGPMPLGPKGIAGIPVDDGSLRVYSRKQYSDKPQNNVELPSLKRGIKNFWRWFWSGDKTL